jgi:hypothetical protein
MPMIHRALAVLLCLCALDTGAQGRKRALLIGINDYSASAIRANAQAAAPGRDWPDLYGAINDAKLLQEMLIAVYGFQQRDIVTLTDQNATRAAILQAIERQLVAPAAKDDVVFFYFAGHGSQVRNSRSDEPDGLDESFIPADSRLGAPDIRDKELRRLFNRVLDRGARLTVLLDACHSGSGARGFPSPAPVRRVKADLRDVRDGADYGPRPERRGALVIAAAQDFDNAQEKADAQGKMHGAFSLAWIRALRDAAAGEAAEETFARAAARMRADVAHQSPVLAGTPQARSAPFLGLRTDQRGGRTVIGVADVFRDGTVRLHGGWANGLSPGTELRVAGDSSSPRLAVTAIEGLARAEARIIGRGALPPSIRSGALLEVVTWSLAPVRPMRVWIPHAAGDFRQLGQRLATLSAKRGVRWIADPTETTPSHVFRWQDAENAIAKLPRRSSVFVQFPPPALKELSADGIAAAARAEDADYVLVGRFSAGELSYAWVRPAATRADDAGSALPPRTAWTTSAAKLRESVIRLRRIHAWLLLESPPGVRPPYRMVLERADGTAVTGNTLTGGEHYTLALVPTRVRAAGRRFVYAFVIDSDGTGTLLFPRDGSVENDVTGGAPELTKFAVGPPYGIDTYVLLITDEPLPNPWVLTWEGIRAGLLASSEWTIERAVFRSVRPRRH